jgi:hypothetical protein
LTSASSSPFSIAATAPAPVPTPTIETSVGFMPSFTRTLFTNMLVDDPGAVTPTFHPFMSFAPLNFAARSFDMASAMALNFICSTTALMGCFFAAMLIVCS